MPADPDDLQRYEEAQGALLSALSRLGVDTNFWAANEPREDEPVGIGQLYERLKELPQFNKAQFSSALREWIGSDPKEHLTHHVLVRSGMVHEIFRGEEITAGIKAVRELTKLEGSVWIQTLLLMANDRLEKGLQDEALRLYGIAIEDCPRPRLDMEVGWELARRAGLSLLPLVDDDGTGPWFLPYIANAASGVNMVAPPRPEIVTPAPPVLRVPDQARASLMRLALEAYGRSYGHCINEPSPSLGPLADDGGVVDYTVDFWRLCALDNLREILTELRYFSEAECAADAELAWHDIFEEASGFMRDKDFARGLSEFTGYVRGRQVESTVQEAVEEARRKIVVPDPDAFATQVARTVAARLGPIPLATRAQLEHDLASALGDAWRALPDSAQQSVIEADWWKRLLEAVDGRDYGPVVIEYARAVEAFLRDLSRSTEFNLSNFRDMFKNHSRVRLNFLKASADIPAVSGKMDELVKARNQAAHGDPRSYRPTTHTRSQMVRDLVAGGQGLLTLLYENRRP